MRFVGGESLHIIYMEGEGQCFWQSGPSVVSPFKKRVQRIALLWLLWPVMSKALFGMADCSTESFSITKIQVP